MSEIADFNMHRKKRSQPVESFTFVQAMEKLAPEVQRVLDDSFSSTTRQAQRIVVGKPNIGVLSDPTPPGTLHPMAGNNTAVITSNGFPNYLVELGNTSERAMNIAGATALSYAALHAWCVSLRHSQRDAAVSVARQKAFAPQYPELWDHESYVPQTGAQSIHTILHRISGGVALATVGIESIGNVGIQPAPLHIASLADPMPIKQMRIIHDVAYSV